MLVMVTSFREAGLPESAAARRAWLLEPLARRAA
jgi:hypothetical protein